MHDDDGLLPGVCIHASSQHVRGSRHPGISFDNLLGFGGFADGGRRWLEERRREQTLCGLVLYPGTTCCYCTLPSTVHYSDQVVPARKREMRSL